MSASDFPPTVRALLVDRDLGRCVRCGRFGETHAHHRQLRSRGGRGVVENGVLLCPLCHEWAHRNVAEATEAGLIVASWSDPAEVPVLTWRGLLLLTRAGEGRVLPGVPGVKPPQDEAERPPGDGLGGPGWGYPSPDF